MTDKPDYGCSGGRLAARNEPWMLVRLTKASSVWGRREAFSAGRDAPALRQARTPAATARGECQVGSAHFRRDIAAKAPPNLWQRVSARSDLKEFREE